MSSPRAADALPAALLEGLLIEQDGCLWLEADDTRRPVLWPEGTYVTVEDGQLVVYTRGDRAAVETRVRLGAASTASRTRASWLS